MESALSPGAQYDHRSQWKDAAHGCNASVLSEAALCGCALSELSVFRYRLADRKRPDKSDSGGSASEKEETWRNPRRDLWHYPDALDLHPVLYVPAEFHVHGLLHLWFLSGCYRLCGMDKQEQPVGHP